MAQRVDYDKLLEQSYFSSWEELHSFANQIRELFPTGKMSDNVTPWRQNKVDIGKKILRFFNDYGFDYTKEQILKATEKYIESFKLKPNYFGMRCSKYFIWKDDVRNHNDVVSELATVLDSLEDGEENISNSSTSWIDELR